MIEFANKRIKPLILLGINCGYENHDCAALSFKWLDLDNGWITYPPFCLSSPCHLLCALCG